ncbi:unnamed protein product [Diplocarpon coronariae]|uniref:Uncharacterized protein n=1 Tax=Diplocarpon coronariae TaxID=2795749 RepID=A0A218YZ57_9HELO|nr:hypothetical protein JHW43_004090 [Diplocarpon mali]OWP00633.1 hypothetical protein B2J93_5409 [Marssonina coronariae]
MASSLRLHDFFAFMLPHSVRTAKTYSVKVAVCRLHPVTRGAEILLVDTCYPSTSPYNLAKAGGKASRDWNIPFGSYKPSTSETQNFEALIDAGLQVLKYTWSINFWDKLFNRRPMANVIILVDYKGEYPTKQGIDRMLHKHRIWARWVTLESIDTLDFVRGPAMPKVLEEPEHSNASETSNKLADIPPDRDDLGSPYKETQEELERQQRAYRKQASRRKRGEAKIARRASYTRNVLEPTKDQLRHQFSKVALRLAELERDTLGVYRETHSRRRKALFWRADRPWLSPPIDYLPPKPGYDS